MDSNQPFDNTGKLPGRLVARPAILSLLRRNSLRYLGFARLMQLARRARERPYASDIFFSLSVVEIHLSSFSAMLSIREKSTLREKQKIQKKCAVSQ